ncbi:MAG TPA: hypothetical protein ENN12_00540 [Epsilonproteobacteria bacterium]|nr:hypothetical protein [Campylobacterota bacterium]
MHKVFIIWGIVDSYSGLDSLIVAQRLERVPPVLIYLFSGATDIDTYKSGWCIYKKSCLKVHSSKV